MSLEKTVSAERIHISFFGRRNAGKSSLVNAITGQELSVVSDVLGTTTDPVKKSMELLPLGPVVIIDTPGFDDEGELGTLRVQKTREILAKTDIAILVKSVEEKESIQDADFISLIKDTYFETYKGEKINCSNCVIIMTVTMNDNGLTFLTNKNLYNN